MLAALVIQVLLFELMPLLLRQSLTLRGRMLMRALQELLLLLL